MRAFYVIPLLALTSCATITADSTQNITVITQPEEATCTLTNAVRTWQIDRTTGSVDVVRDSSPLDILCWSKEKKGHATLEAETRGRAWGNLLLLGVPAIVDAETGKGYEYKSAVVITLTKPDSAAAPAAVPTR